MKAATGQGGAVRRRDLLVAVLAPLAVSNLAMAQARPPALKTRSISTTHFRIEIPEKDWRLMPGGLNTLGVLAQKDGAAAIVIEHEMLQIALKPEEVDATFVEIESTTIKERETAGSGFIARIDPNGSRRAVIDFQRRAAAGTEQVRVVVLVHGKHLYRLIAVALQSQFARYEQVFQSVAASFTPLDPAS